MLEFGSPASSFHTSSSCNALFRELQQMWTEIGESEVDKDRMLMELERECLEIYRRKVEEVANTKAWLHQSIAAKEAELATLTAALAEVSKSSPIRADKRSISLKEKLSYITPLLEDLKLKKDERIKQFRDIKAQIDQISGELSGYCHLDKDSICLSATKEDLSLRKLAEYQTCLESLRKEKSDRLDKVLEYVNEVHTLCSVLGMDFARTVNDVHPSLHRSNTEVATNISDSTLEGLHDCIQKLKAERKIRIQKLKDVVSSLSELWSLMDSPEGEKGQFLRITYVLQSSDPEITDPGLLSTDTIEQASAELERLSRVKESRMKELVLKRRSELEEICRLAHMEPDLSTATEKTNVLMDAGLVNASELLANIEAQIAKAKDEAASRKEIMDRIDRWLSACEEENWLENYNQDENRYNAGRGGHINLKRAERARITVSKIPAMVDNLINKTIVWEEDKKMPFLYDGVRLVSILEEYKVTRQQKEEEKKRFKDQKKLQDLLLREKESLYGSKPSPRKTNSFRKTNEYPMNGNDSTTSTPRRNSGSAAHDIVTPRSYSARQNGYSKEMRRLSTVPINFVAIPKDDTTSTYTSIGGSEPGSPPHGQI